jgi:hypothetical protein
MILCQKEWNKKENMILYEKLKLRKYGLRSGVDFAGTFEDKNKKLFFKIRLL